MKNDNRKRAIKLTTITQTIKHLEGATAFKKKGYLTPFIEKEIERLNKLYNKIQTNGKSNIPV